MTNISRRSFLTGCGLATCGVLAPRMAFSAAEDTDNILIVLFQRGGCDGLNLFPPISGADRGYYENGRPNIQVPLTGTNAALPLNSAFGFHPAASGLKTLYDQGRMAIVRATGNSSLHTRSHFQAQALLETGIPGSLGGTTGWLTRYFSSIPNLPPSIIIPSVAASGYTPSSFLGDASVLTMSDPGNFAIDTSHWAWDSRQMNVAANLFNPGNGATDTAADKAMTAVNIIGNQDFNNYVPAGGAVYPDNYLGDRLKMLAQIIKMDVGFRVGAVDAGGWDTHDEQGDNGGGDFAGLVGSLSESLLAFYTDLMASSGLGNRVTTVVQTEFGRRFEENGDTGTDHGTGADMMVLGGSVNGGQIYGSWPGLAPAQLFEGDVQVTTDFRQVLSEVLIRRMENPALGQIFPGYSNYSPLGIVQGSDLPPDYSNGNNDIFADGFED